MMPCRSSEWVRRWVVLDLSSLSKPSASPAAPSRLSRATEGVDQPQPVAAGRGADAHLTHAHAVAKVLAVPELAFDTPALRIQVHQFARGLVGGVGDQAPGLLHVLGVDAHHSADRVVEAGDGGAV